MRHGTYGTTLVQHRCIADGSRQNCVPMKGHCEHLVVVVVIALVVVVVVVLVALLVVCVMLLLLYWHRLWELTVAIAFCLMQFAIDFFLSLLLLFE